MAHVNTVTNVLFCVLCFVFVFLSFHFVTFQRVFRVGGSIFTPPSPQAAAYLGHISIAAVLGVVSFMVGFLRARRSTANDPLHVFMAAVAGEDTGRALPTA